MDLEDLREVIADYQKCVAETVGRFGGFVAKYMGDGVLVYFGYSQAHEDDAERAMRAGLELVACGWRPEDRRATPDARWHRNGSGGSRRSNRVRRFSGASNSRRDAELAERLQGVAEQNSVVIAESTRKLIGNLFELEDLGGKDLKGIAGRARDWAVLRARFGGRQFRGNARYRIDRACWLGRRTRTAATALVEGKDWRRLSGAPVGRGRDREV